jgi:hypothetical protein
LIFGPHIAGESLSFSEDTIATGSWRPDDPLQIWDFGTAKLVKNVRFLFSFFCLLLFSKVFYPGSPMSSVFGMFDCFFQLDTKCMQPNSTTPAICWPLAVQASMKPKFSVSTKTIDPSAAFYCLKTRASIHSIFRPMAVASPLLALPLASASIKSSETWTATTKTFSFFQQRSFSKIFVSFLENASKQPITHKFYPFCICSSTTFLCFSFICSTIRCSALAVAVFLAAISLNRTNASSDNNTGIFGRLGSTGIFS